MRTTNSGSGNITIFTDAGLKLNEKGVWAMYARGNFNKEARLIKYGVLKRIPTSPTEAEMMAICNALKLVRDLHLSNFVGVLTLYTDSLSSIDLLTGGVVHKNLREVTSRAKELLKDLNPKRFNLKKVKAHSKAKTMQNYLNNLVDDYCRKAYKL